MLPWRRRRPSRLCWPQTATPDSSWPRWTRCGSARTFATWGWRLAAASSGSTDWCSPPAARTSPLFSPGGWWRRIKRRCRSLEWRRRSLRFCWTSYTQVCNDPDIPISVFNKICVFLYHFLIGNMRALLPGVISVTVENVQELMVAADMLQLSEVVSICGEFLKGHMDPSNCVGIFQFLEQIACMDMLEFTENYIHVHFLEVWNNNFVILSLCQYSAVSVSLCSVSLLH